jgi:hypothetical protein
LDFFFRIQTTQLWCIGTVTTNLTETNYDT